MSLPVRRTPWLVVRCKRSPAEEQSRSAGSRGCSPAGLAGPDSCGLERMNEGERYTVFARTEGGQLLSGLCDGTHSGGPDPALALVSGVLLPPTPGAPPWWILSLIVIAAVLAGAVGMRARRVLRNRRQHH